MRMRDAAGPGTAGMHERAFELGAAARVKDVGALGLMGQDLLRGRDELAAERSRRCFALADRIRSAGSRHGLAAGGFPGLDAAVEDQPTFQTDEFVEPEATRRDHAGLFFEEHRGAVLAEAEP